MLSRSQGIRLLNILIIGSTMQACVGRSEVTPPEVIPTTTKTITSTATESLSSSPSATNSVTPESIETTSIGTLMASAPPRTIANYPSSDGRWRAEVIRYECAYVNQNYNEAIAYEQLKLINLRDGTEKIVADQRQNCGGLGAFGFAGLYWSPNNRYFYYSESREGSPDGGCGNYIPLPIYRLDTVSQESIMLNGGILSPNERRLAMWQGNQIVIWDLDKGEIDRVTPLRSDLFKGRMWWSTEANSIVYLQTEFECGPNFGKSYLVSLDLTSLSQKLITEYEMTNKGFVSTPAPAGVFVFYFYSPLLMNYDTSIWEIKDGLRAKQVASCLIGEQGPTDFSGPHASQFAQLGDIRYEVLNFPEPSSDQVTYAYLADQAHATEAGLPVFWVTANRGEWSKCKLLAENVLSTLHFPP